MSAELMAAQTFRTGQAVRRWKQGKVIPPELALIRFAECANAHAKTNGHDVLDVDPDELLRLREVAIRNRKRAGADVD